MGRRDTSTYISFRSKLDKQFREAYIQAVVDTAIELQKKARKNATGRPGPNVDSGNLRRSIRILPVPTNQLEKIVIAGGTGAVNYAAFVEFGTINAPAYPFLQPAIESVRPKHRKRVADIAAGKFKFGL